MSTLSKEKCIEELRKYNRNEIITLCSHTVADIIYHLNNPDRASEVGVQPEVKQLLADIEEYKQTFDLQHKCYVEANLYWQKATGKLHTWNDLGELLKFLMDRIVELETPAIISGEPFRVEKVDSKQSV